MQRRAIPTLLLVFCVVLTLMAVPAAARPVAPAGDRIDIWLGTPTTYAADAPFHLLHGWKLNPSNGLPPGRFGFRLYIDDVGQGSGIWITEQGTDPENPLLRRRLFNYEAGLPAGIHTFVGEWYAPCLVAIDYDYPGPCSKPKAMVLAVTLELQVGFTG